VLIGRLSLSGFRSYEQLEVEFPTGPQVLFGANAAGKTNLIEAIVVLGRGSSHRTSSDAELVSWGAPLARLEVELAQPGGEGKGPPGATLDVALAGLGAESVGSRKRVRVNGVARRASALAGSLPLVLFAPEEMLLVSGSPSLRRAAIDGLAATRSRAYASSLATYARALQQRNSLLRQIRENLADPSELHYWDAIIVDEGGALVAERLELLAALAEPLAAAHREIAPAEGRLGLRYATNAPTSGSETPRDALRRRLAETAEKELWNGATLVGPHRDDAVFELDGRDLAGFGSRGQQRTAILALKLAEVELLTSEESGPPLLLLDDVFSELDPERRAHLVRRIRDLPQAFVTTTALEDLDPELVAESTAWRVVPGRLERIEASIGRSVPA
jgi:DNA replication and repair protein RecF